MKNLFTKKKRIICFSWSLIGIILLVSIHLFKDTSFQETIGNIVLCYVFGSCILSGVIGYISKKEKQK